MKRLKLHHWILLAMILGAAIGLPLNLLAASDGIIDQALVETLAGWGKGLGSLFLRLLQMLVVPLIASSLIAGVASMGNLKQLGRLGGRTLLFYLSTSFLAIITGLLVVNLFEPGVGADLGLLQDQTPSENLPVVASEEGKGLASILWAQLTGMIPQNPLHAAAEGDMLPIIFFSLSLGIFISFAEHEDEAEDEGPFRSSSDSREKINIVTFRRFWQGLFAVMMKMTLAVIQLAPLGVFGFMLYAAAGHGLQAFEALGIYALTVATGLFIHAFLVLPLVLRFFAKKSPLAHARAMTPALLTAFSTASSNGTLPLTMQCVERAGVPSRIGSFVLPLGATINMDGTALYEAVAVLFIAQAYGMDLSLGQQAVVALTALLASVGAAGIPHAGTVMMVVVLTAVGLPTTAVGLILAVDRILDMCRTTVNVWSDSIAASIISTADES